MHSGLMWFDNSKKSMSAKILDAAKRYKEKYGLDPNIAYVNPHDFKDIDVNGISVSPKLTILLNNVWIGIRTS